MLGRGVDEQHQHDGQTPWDASLLPWFSRQHADVRIVNLETSITTSEAKWPNKAFNYRATPATARLALQTANIDYVSLANNHILDYQVQGMVDTLDALDQMGIRHAGAGANLEQASRPAILDVKSSGLRLGCFSFSDHYREWAATDQDGGIALVTYDDACRQYLRRLITSHRQKDRLDVVLVSIHWGPNYAWQPSADIQSLAHFLIDECQVDVIHGHSAHHIQGIEIYHGRPILYGCGDLVDDYAIDREYRNDLGLVYLVSLGEQMKLKRVDLVPTRIHGCQVGLASQADDGAWLNETIHRLSFSKKDRLKKDLDEKAHDLVRALRTRTAVTIFFPSISGGSKNQLSYVPPSSFTLDEQQPNSKDCQDALRVLTKKLGLPNPIFLAAGQS